MAIESQFSRRNFMGLSSGLLMAPWVEQVLAGEAPKSGKKWKIAIHMDTAVKTLGHHGLHAAFIGLPHVEIVGLFDTNLQGIEERMANSTTKRHYTDFEKLLQEEKPDIVVLSSRLPNVHFEQIKTCVKYGCHIYCEKPITSNLEEADEILRLAEQAKLTIGMAHPCRNALGFLTMKKLIEEGKIGTPLTVQGWGKSDHRGGGEDMMTLGTHIFDLMVFFFGAPEEVYGDVRSEGKPFAGPHLNVTKEDVGPAAGDEIFATFRFKNRVRGIWESRRDLYTSRDNRMGISVIGSKGALSFRFSDADRDPQPLRFTNAPCAPAAESVYEDIELIETRHIEGAEPIQYNRPGLPRGPIFVDSGRHAAWNLMRCIESGKRPIANAYDARTALEMIYGVYASHLKRGPVSFPLEDRRHPLREFKLPETTK